MEHFAITQVLNSAAQTFDAEDVALSAFHSLCEGVKRGRFPRLDDRGNLWSLLVVITARKARARIRSASTQKRGGGNVQGESVFTDATDRDDVSHRGIEQMIGSEPTADFAAQVSEESERLLGLLLDDSMRSLALLKLEGFSNKEAAEELQCGLRTVERRLSLIRQIWEEKG